MSTKVEIAVLVVLLFVVDSLGCLWWIHWWSFPCPLMVEKCGPARPCFKTSSCLWWIHWVVVLLFVVDSLVVLSVSTCGGKVWSSQTMLQDSHLLFHLQHTVGIASPSDKAVGA